MIFITLGVGFVVSLFSCNYIQRDNKTSFFTYNVFLLIGSLILLACSNHFVLFGLSWIVSNALLVRLMMYAQNWSAARQAGRIAGKYFALSSLFLSLSFLSFYATSNVYTIQQAIVLSSVHNNPLIACGLLLMIIAAAIQSSLMPFHNWLLNSLNSPTPVSAFMHAGLVNGGGFLLVRFSHLLLQFPFFLQGLFVLGIESATVAIFYKLIQPDVKRMLACSTIAQMGFVFMQCGSGLFAAAAAHLCWHGFFKAYLFLSSSTIDYKRQINVEKSGFVQRMAALLYALCSTVLFAQVYTLSLSVCDTSLLLLIVAFVASFQMSITMLKTQVSYRMLFSFLLAQTLILAYAFIDMSIDSCLESLHALQPQPLTFVSGAGLVLLVIGWGLMMLYPFVKDYKIVKAIYAKLYVLALRKTQPCMTASTMLRNQYTLDK